MYTLFMNPSLYPSNLYYFLMSNWLQIILLGTKCDLKWADQSTLEDMRVANQAVGEMVSVAQGNIYFIYLYHDSYS